MSGASKILYVGDPAATSGAHNNEALLGYLRKSFDVVQVRSPLRALARLSDEKFDAIYVASDHLKALQFGALLENERILQEMPDGVVVVDVDNSIVWGNGRLAEWMGRDQIAGENFYHLLDSPENLGPDFCPFHTALRNGLSSGATLRTKQNRFFQIHAAPIHDGDEPPRHLIVTVRDVTGEMLDQQKLKAIHRAGVELSDLKPEELLHMSFAERIELLKSNILHFTQDLLSFDVVEIRLLNLETSRLELLLAEGMNQEAMDRELFAHPQNNGVTGFVASTGKSYLCEDTTLDPLYLEGAKDAKSSLTVPLILHDEVIGTFNVESPRPRAFGESDLQFLEVFTREVALALNTLDLLAAEEASTTAKSVEAIHRAVALPIDEILNDAVNLMERYIGHDPDVADRLRNILRHARDIKQVIQKVGQKMSPGKAHPRPWENDDHPRLRHQQILVVDADESVRSAAHDLLERYGCIVETAHDAAEAVSMVRNVLPGFQYNCIIADIRLPDMNGYDLMLKLGEVINPLPLVLMTGFGYDPGHTLVKARQAGLDAVLFKPFRLDQLLETVEKVVQ